MISHGMSPAKRIATSGGRNGRGFLGATARYAEEKRRREEEQKTKQVVQDILKIINGAKRRNA